MEKQKRKISILYKSRRQTLNQLVADMKAINIDEITRILNNKEKGLTLVQVNLGVVQK